MSSEVSRKTFESRIVNSTVRLSFEKGVMYYVYLRVTLITTYFALY
jgi:hypothetical protein